jgi:hypothetical protein
MMLCLWPQNFSGDDEIVIAIFMNKIEFVDMVLIVNLGHG